MNIHRIQIKNEETKLQARIEAAELSNIIQAGHPRDYSTLEIANVPEASKQIVQELMNSLSAKLKRLQMKEDDFNKNAALVPETDPNVTLINDRI